MGSLTEPTLTQRTAANDFSRERPVTERQPPRPEREARRSACEARRSACEARRWHEREPALAGELAALYHERWEIETALDELKTHLRGSKIVLRSKTPELVRQEFYGLMLAHFAIRGLMHEAALKADSDPDKLSFTHSVRVIRRKPPHFVAIPPSARTNLS